MVLFLALAIILLGQYIPAHAQQQSKPLLELAANYWEPYTGPKAHGQGIATEIVVTAFAHAGYPVHIQFMPWSRVLMMAYAGQVNGIVGIWYTAQRSTKLLYSESYLINDLSFYRTRSGRCGYNKKDLSQTIKIGVGRDYDYSDIFLQNYGTSLVPGDRLAYNLMKLKAGRIDLLLEDKHILQFALTEHPRILDTIQILPCSESPQMRLPLYFALNANFPNAQKVISDFNTEIRKMKKTGELDAILNRLVTSIH